MRFGHFCFVKKNTTVDGSEIPNNHLGCKQLFLSLGLQRLLRLGFAPKQPVVNSGISTTNLNRWVYRISEPSTVPALKLT